MIHNEKEIYPLKISQDEIQQVIHGHKTQLVYSVRSVTANKYMTSGRLKRHRLSFTWFEGLSDVLRVSYAYGEPGEYLWVKEDFRWVDAEGNHKWNMLMHPQYRDNAISNMVFAVDPDYYIGEYSHDYRDGWIPASSMAYVYCRMKLEITRVRVLRGTELTEEDFIAQGYWAGSDQTPMEWFGDQVKLSNSHNFVYTIDFTMIPLDIRS